MDKNTLTKRQEEIYAFIKDCILNKGYPPSVREIGDKVGFIDLKGKPLTIKKRGLKKLTENMNNVEKMKLVFNCQEI